MYEKTNVSISVKLFVFYLDKILHIVYGELLKLPLKTFPVCSFIFIKYIHIIKLIYDTSIFEIYANLFFK